jgi:hypothetical protein
MNNAWIRQLAKSVPVAAMAFMNSTAQASLTAETTGASTSTLVVELAFLLVVSACILTTVKIYASVRGGSIALGWRWIASGLGLLGLSQLVLIGQQIGVFSIADLWVNSMRVLAILSVFIGVAHIRKLLA